MEGFNSVIYGPVSYTWQNVTYSQYGVVASNKYNAAAVALGYNPDNFSSEVKAKLSNSSTGGSFYTIAQEFENPDPDGLSVTVQGVAPGFWATAYGLYGEGNVWYAELTKTAITSATEDLQTILNGGSLGGSTSEIKPPAGDYYLFDLDDTNYASYGTFAPTNKTRYVLYQKSMIDDFVSGMSAQISGYSPYFHVTKHGSVLNIEISMFRGLVIDGPVNYRFRVTGQGYMIGYNSSTGAQGLEGYVGSYQGDSTGFYFLYGSVSRQYWIYNTASFYFDFYPTYILRPLSDARVVTYDGNGNWPSNPVVDTPTPPEVPGPTNDTPTPQPDPPTFQVNPTFPVYVDVSTTTYTVDLQGILDAMNDHCIHLQDALHWNFDHFWTVLSTKWTNDLSTFKTFLDGQFGWIGDTIVDQMQETRDYLKELFEWLADQFAFESGGSYNDSTVISWLKKIYSKLGTGSNSRPTDPVADPVETGSWLDTLINNLLVALGSLFPSLIGGVTDFFSGVADSAGDLTKKFPVSLPWDIAALLALLVAEPVAPVLDIPCYTLGANGLSQVGTYHITLADYGTAWEGVRVAMLIGFAVYLVAHTKDFLDVIEGVLL